MNKESRIKNSKRNLIYGMITYAFTTLLTFISRTLFIKLLGVEYLGINGLYSNVLQLLSLTELGLSSIGLYMLYNPLVNKDEEEINKLVTYFEKLYKIISVSILAIGISFMPFFKYIINSELTEIDLLGYYFLFLLNSALSYICISKQLLINADQKVYIVKNTNTIFLIIQNIIQIIILYFIKNYYLYLLVQCFCTLMLNVYLNYRAKKMYPFLRKNVNIDKSTKKNIFLKMKDLFIYKVSAVIVNCTDNIFISVLLGTSIVGYYSNYSLIITSITSIMTIIVDSIRSSVGNLNVKETNEKKIDVFYKLLFIMQWIVGFFSVCLILLSSDFITLWIGKNFVIPTETVFIIILNFYVSNIINPVWMYREAMGLFGKVKFLMLMTAILNIILTYFFGIFFGLTGIFLATIFARLLTTVWYEPIILIKNELQSNVGMYYKTLIKYFLIFILLLIVCSIVVKPILVNNYIMWFAKAIVIGVIFNLMYLMIFRKNENFKFIINKIVKKQKN